MNHEPTNAERAEKGDRVAALFIEQAAGAGTDLTAEHRADLGRRMVEEYNGGPVAEGDAPMILAGMIADLYHYADGTVSPGAMLGAALMELSATVNTLPVLCALGEEGRPGILACALAAAIAYGETVGACPAEITDHAYLHWSDEVEEERFMRVRAERQRHGA
ncbi:hypothetical protein [Streptomyces atacamensis]|uniref:hypothetical protein n=1 Tax=Streptomyces atacamensis TaxID=531966 RepID=UPI00399CD854